MELVTHDRGLGTAYERYCFYQRLEQWATEYGVESMLEGPVDGMAGIAGVHGVGLARRGVRVVSAVDTPERARIARAVYDASGSTASSALVDVVSPSDLATLPSADLVLAYHALDHVPDWRAYLAALAKHAKKLFVVAVCNPDNWGVSIIRSVARVRGIRGMEAPEPWQTSILAPVLWDLGRVKDHVFFDCPWWPDLQVSPGQSLFDRAKKLFTTKRREVEFTASGAGSLLAERFVYGPERWPYFGGSGWLDELLPALLRHPCFDGGPPKLVKRAAHLHAFVVDMRPRTPQARRRLPQAYT
jgi:hypothetical protein